MVQLFVDGCLSTFCPQRWGAGPLPWECQPPTLTLLVKKAAWSRDEARRGAGLEAHQGPAHTTATSAGNGQRESFRGSLPRRAVGPFPFRETLGAADRPYFLRHISLQFNSFLWAWRTMQISQSSWVRAEFSCFLFLKVLHTDSGSKVKEGSVDKEKPFPPPTAEQVNLPLSLPASCNYAL